MDRSTVFSLALRSSGLTMAGFIDKYLAEPAAEGVVYRVVRDPRKSARINTAIERLIADEAPRVRLAFSSHTQRVAA